MSSMENMMHNYLVKLRVISKIPEHGKLDITHNDLNIYYGGMVGWIIRKIYGDSKENSTKYLIELYREINAFSDQIMYNISMEQNDILKRKKIAMLVSLAEKMKSSLIGIRNLIGTYKDYLKIISLLENLEQDILIPQYKILIKFIPDKYHTEILKLPISYTHIHNSGLFSHDNELDKVNEETMQVNIERKSNNTLYKEPEAASDNDPTREPTREPIREQVHKNNTNNSSMHNISKSNKHNNKKTYD